MLELFSRDGALWDEKGNRVQLRGVNYFGLETADFAPHGLWTQEPLLKQLDQIAGPSCGFNALRIPFSCELALNLDTRHPTNIDYGANPQLKGLSSGAVLDCLVSECAKRGIVILLDMHRMEAAGEIPELWYSPKHPESAVATAWRLMAKRYAPCWNVIGADLNNEPHGCATWERGRGNVATNWRAAAERLGRVVLEANPRLLVFVEGVERCLRTGDGSWWGGHLGDAAEHPVELPVKDKLVYSPHVYGPDVHEQVYFGSAGFEKFLPKIWREHFAFAVCDPKKRLGPAVVPGEWGGFARAGTKDAVWQETIAKWMSSDESGIESSFHWCWQCNSGDTGGIVGDDWSTLQEHKLKNIGLAHPQPTQFPKEECAPPDHAVTPESCACETGVDPGGAAAGSCPAPAPAAAPAQQQQQQQQQQPQQQPPAGEVVFSDPGKLTVRRANAWMDGPTECVQLDCAVEQPGASLSLTLPAGATIKQSWNCTPRGDGGGAVFGPPEWAASGAGQPYVAGLVVTGGLPTAYSLV